MKQQVHKHQQGFTLVELMVVVAIAAILVSIALPTYMDYLVRSKVAEMILAASPLRTAITESAQQKGSLTGAGAGLAVSKVKAQELLDMLSTLGEHASFERFWPLLRNA